MVTPGCLTLTLPIKITKGQIVKQKQVGRETKEAKSQVKWCRATLTDEFWAGFESIFLISGGNELQSSWMLCFPYSIYFQLTWDFFFNLLFLKENFQRHWRGSCVAASTAPPLTLHHTYTCCIAFMHKHRFDPHLFIMNQVDHSIILSFLSC